ncbi:hypothetical protein Droror1_Dr00027998 [Drosera rotundifolia]
MNLSPSSSGSGYFAGYFHKMLVKHRFMDLVPGDVGFAGEETIDFDVLVCHFSYYEEHAKDEHVKPIMEQIEKLGEALYNFQFEHHWLEAQTDRQSIINEGMSKRALHKALFESAALVAASVVQVFLLKRLFERKLSMSRA